VARLTIRRGDAGDLAVVARIQESSPEASQWEPRDYLAHDFAVAVCDDRVAGFAVARRVANAESEILNLAVDPAFRRRGIGRMLVDEIRLRHPGDIFLEVRESNQAARGFYERLGFQMVTVRPGYYERSREGAIVMKFHSC
jgi:ribosomal-protein-alanine N-acetyltransferase